MYLLFLHVAMYISKMQQELCFKKLIHYCILCCSIISSPLIVHFVQLIRENLNSKLVHEKRNNTFPDYFVFQPYNMIK